MRRQNIVTLAAAAAMIAGCATEPSTSEPSPAPAATGAAPQASAPAKPPSKVAIVISGDLNPMGSTRFGPEVSVADVDGKRTDAPQGPILLDPGTHSIGMKCGDTVTWQTLKVAAGEVYLFAMRVTPGERGCTGYLSRIRSAARLV